MASSAEVEWLPKSAFPSLYPGMPTLQPKGEFYACENCFPENAIPALDRSQRSDRAFVAWGDNYVANFTANCTGSYMNGISHTPARRQEIARRAAAISDLLEIQIGDPQ
jgi:hypothetical protein